MRKSGISLGVDIGEQDVKIIAIRKQHRRYEIVHATHIALPDGSHPDEVGTTLAQFLRESALPYDSCACAIQAHRCSIKFTQLPKAKPADTARMAQMEAEAQIPLPLNDLAWGYMTEDDPATSMQHVVIAGARSEIVDQLLASCTEAGISPSSIQVSCLAALNALALPASGGSTLLLAIGPEWTDLCLLEGTMLRGCRSAKLGVNDINRSPRYEKRSAEWASRLAQEIRQSLHALTGNGTYAAPQRIILAGDIPSCPDFRMVLAEQTGLPVELVAPWSQAFTYRANRELTEELPASFAVATGLAVSALTGAAGVNLIPAHIAVERQQQRKMIAAMVSLGIVGVLLTPLVLSGEQAIRDKTDQLERATRRVHAKQREVQRLGPGYHAVAVAIQETIADVKQVESNPLEILRRLSADLPKEITLVEFSYVHDKSIVLKGQAPSNDAIADTVRTLSVMKLFQDPRLDFANRVTKEGVTGYDFQVTCPLSGAGRSAKTAKGKRSSQMRQQTGITVR